jgi:hypothetical protein
MLPRPLSPLDRHSCDEAHRAAVWVIVHALGALQTGMRIDRLT